MQLFIFSFGLGGPPQRGTWIRSDPPWGDDGSDPWLKRKMSYGPNTWLNSIWVSVKIKENRAFMRNKRKKTELNWRDFNEFYPKIHTNALVRHSQHFPPSYVYFCLLGPPSPLPPEAPGSVGGIPHSPVSVRGGALIGFRGSAQKLSSNTQYFPVK